MTPSDMQPPSGALTRRQLRERQTGGRPGDGATTAGIAASPTSASVRSAPTPEAFSEEPSVSPETTADAALHPGGTALAWVRPDQLQSTSPAYEADAPPLLEDGPRRSRLRPAISIPLLGLAALAGAYVVTMILWPLHAVAPRIMYAEIAPATGPAASIAWSPIGVGGVGIEGIGVSTSASEAMPIASLTKVAFSLMVLEELPLQPGESGPSFEFTWSDSNSYWSYRSRNESALDVPIGDTLTQYELLQGILMGSANNYTQRLSQEIWGSNDEFAVAAEEWLAANDLTSIALVEPTGIDARNTADPESLIRLSEIAMAHPVVREIVGTAVAELPGAGEVLNTNPLLGTDGVTGVKTGSLSSERSGVGRELVNLMASKEVLVGETTVPISIAVLGQPDADSRLAEVESLFAQVEAALAAQGPAVAAGTVAASIATVWGDGADVVTDEAMQVVLWNGAEATLDLDIDFDLANENSEGAAVGTFTAVGPIDTSASTLSLTAPIDRPSVWWRLTHPLDLLGLN